MKNSTPLNPGLTRLHTGFFVFYAFFIPVLMFWASVEQGNEQAEDAAGMVAILFVPVAILHAFAAKGTRSGRSYGRTVSRMVAVLWFVGFPIGTALAIYVFRKTGRRSWKSIPA